MSQGVRYQLWIVAAASVIFFTNLGSTGLWDMDEALYSTCAREMLDGRTGGNLIVPWFNGDMFPEKPVLMFWTMMGGYKLFGINEWGARFFSAVMGVGTALVAFHLGRILFNLRVGLWTGLITASTILFTISARAATVDSALTFFTASAFLMFVMGRVQGSGFRVQATKSGSQSTINSQQSKFPLPYAIAAYACIGVAVLGKGPVGMLLPLAAMGLFLLTVNGWRSLFRSAWWMRPVTALVVIGVVAVPWYVAVGYQTNGEWPKQFFLQFNLRPFQKPIQGHGDALSALVSLLYYFYQVLAVLIFFFPWSVFLGPTVVDAVRRLREGKRENGENGNGRTGKEAARWREGVLLAICWFAVWLVFWSVCKTKLPHYLLPAYPALALLTACFIDRWLGNPASIARWGLRNAWISLIVVGVGIMIAIPILADGKVLTIPILTQGFLPGEGRLGLLGLLLALGGAWCWWKTSHGQCNDAGITFAVTSVAFLTAVFGFAALRVDQFQNAKPMMAAILADEKGSGVPPAHPSSPVATYRFFRESTVFYGGKPVTKCDNDEATGRSAQETLARFIARPGRSYVITTAEYEPEIKKAFADDLQVMHRERRFLADGEMVIFRKGD
jgi:4-amino-4-deoxy-L-arabinose transferase-like glycosyltransferase